MPSQPDQLQYVESSMTAADGTVLFYREWLVADARGAVELVHGLGEHGGRYTELAQLMNRNGLSVRIHDHRGHGRSGGARGSLTQQDDLLIDLKLVFDDFCQQQQTVPFLFGHSLGGLVAARFATGSWSPVRGLMLSSPALALRLSGFQKVLLALSSRLAPGLAVPTGLPPTLVSHDAAAVQAYRADPLNHNRAAARMVNFMLEAGAQVQRDAASFSLPLLLQIAGDDAFVDPRGSRDFFARLPAVDKTFHCYADAYHEIFNESPERRVIVERDMQSWLDLHV